VLSNPGVLTAYLGDEVLPPVRVTEEVIVAGQRRGEVRADEPAEALGVIVLYAVLFSTQRGATIGRPEGSAPLGRLALEITLRGMRPDGGQPEHAAGPVPGPPLTRSARTRSAPTGSALITRRYRPPGQPRLPGRNTLLPEINMVRLAYFLRLRRPVQGACARPEMPPPRPGLM
jgi:hypothetical protein